jgi:glycosyltransferase involved in cell wall biosynthesis/SAM-dependent methyltransferase
MTVAGAGLVSCIMPTANRRRFVQSAIAQFLAQDYPEAELVILDDGDDPVSDLIPSHPSLRYLRTPRHRSLGVKRNVACEASRGDIILHWDDDDWYAPHRIRIQVEALQASGAELCGIDRPLFFDPRTPAGWEYVYPPGSVPWVYGATQCYHRDYWRAHPFADMNVGEDTHFAAVVRPGQLCVLSDNRFFVALVHTANTSPKHVRDPRWRPFHVAVLRALTGPDWPSPEPASLQVPYRSAGAAQVTATNRAEQATSSPESSPERARYMITVAKESTLALPEFAAFNQGQLLPRMRCWELPFALFQSQLTNTMAVLDCTINPVTFQERLACLYPHVLYRHWSPIQSGAFQLSSGIPDEAFDRVICVNTLEHLLRPQRQALVSAMARKLKPGGCLILTCDFYFDSFWNEPAFLASGLMRADRAEVFNGFNKVTAHELIELGQTNGMVPLCGEKREPVESDPTLYRQQLPFPHACVAVILRKGPELVEPIGKKVVLALLSWNTRDVTVDSLRAYIREAQMLRRLGLQPLICVCDNGSTDGAAAVLQKCEPDIEYPHRFILNTTNLGNSVGRNQIVEFAREMDADYILFMDGDIEVVPFSSFAMLRYMENSGRELGCIGACSAGQTPHRQSASPSFYSIGRVETTDLVAWTQYGMFRREIFDDGIRFDESEAFTGPGWGFEDNDLAFQLKMKGYVNQRFFGMTYLHRNIQSSVRIMRGLGIDVRALYQQRRAYVIDKWSNVPQINGGPLQYVRTVDIRL